MPQKSLKPLRTTKPIKPLKPLKPKPIKATPLKPAKPLKPATPLQPKSDPEPDLARETTKILRLKEEIGERFWDLGQCLLRVHDRALYTQAGFESFEQYLGKKGVDIGKSTAYRLMDLAKNFSRELARKHGQSKLMAAIELAASTPEEDRPIDVLAYQVETRKDGKTVIKPFKDATVREIKGAAQRQRIQIQRVQQKPRPLPGSQPKPAWQAEALRSLRAIAPEAKLSVKTGKGTDPEMAIELAGIPRSRLREALARLARAVPEA
ncbi:MAG: hypothetical protein JXR96_19270 [Deltaproteobacteria bacterium]|nr:hypothetical protein [Deltaproteobacteria bacterium]